MTLPRLNGIIRQLEQGKIAFGAFSPCDLDPIIAFSTSAYDGLVIETEHNLWNAAALRDAFQYLLNRKGILDAASPAPPVTPIVRIPANGAEKNEWFAKQALDLGAYGIIWPHVSTVEQAINAVAACRYPRPKEAPALEPHGQRGDGPHWAVRYWGVSQQEYYSRADTWPLAPHGEILTVLMIEDVEGITNLRDILREVSGIGAILIGEGDLSQELGVPRQYDHPIVREAMTEIVRIGVEENVVVGHPHVTAQNVERVIEEGYRFLLTAPVRTTPGLDLGRKLAGRL